MSEAYKRLLETMKQLEDRHQNEMDEVIERHAVKEDRFRALSDPSLRGADGRGLDEEFKEAMLKSGAQDTYDDLCRTLGGEKRMKERIQIMLVDTEKDLPKLQEETKKGHPGSTYITVYAIGKDGEHNFKDPEVRKTLIARIFHEVRARSERAEQIFLKEVDPTLEDWNTLEEKVRELEEAFEDVNRAIEEEIAAHGHIHEKRKDLRAEFVNLTFAEEVSPFFRDYSSGVGPRRVFEIQRATGSGLAQDATVTHIEVRRPEKVRRAKISGVAFDFGDTLVRLPIKSWRVMAEVLADAFYGHRYTKSDVKKLAGYIYEETAGMDLEKQMKWLRERAIERGQSSNVQSWQYYYDTFREKWRIVTNELINEDSVIEGVVELLEEFSSRGVRLYVVTGRNRADAVELIKKLGLSRYFGEEDILGDIDERFPDGFTKEKALRMIQDGLREEFREELGQIDEKDPIIAYLGDDIGDTETT